VVLDVVVTALMAHAKQKKLARLHVASSRMSSADCEGSGGSKLGIAASIVSCLDVGIPCQSETVIGAVVTAT
jgi:hypothetical protein